MRSKANIAICSYFATRKTNIDNISPGDHFLTLDTFQMGYFSVFNIITFMSRGTYFLTCWG